jgi:endonuclease IV
MTLESTIVLEKHAGESTEVTTQFTEIVPLVSGGKNNKFAVFIIVVGSW